ncbi:mitochondrial antiviral-signaling protein isoform X2 [Saccopteryx leptura]|uniref:mitochondrial antiviral-signaling protein isoform X2 n=1 Tax=Saccopteryx leptura TaxID=249018 RepID=UPI00339CF928
MTFAEDKTYEFIRHHFRKFYHIHVLEILPYLSCLTTSDQDQLRALYDHRGNRNTIWELFNSLRRRSGWVESLIRALRACELAGLADEVAHVYHSNLSSNQNRTPAPPELSPGPAEAPRPSTPAVAPTAPHNSYRDEEPSYPMPVQDTHLPPSPGESSKKAPQTSSSGADPRRPGGPVEPSSDTAALSPLTSSGLQKQDTELGSTHTAGTSPRGPMSPTVSFQPLAHPTARASRSPGPSVPAPSTGATSSSAGGAGDQAEATLCSSGVEVPTNTMTTSIAPSKVPVRSAVTSTVPSKLSTSSKSSGIMPTNVSPSLVPSKLPINSTRVGTVPPKVPTGMGPEHRMPTSSVPSKVPANTAASSKVSKRPVEETPVSPVPTGSTAGGSSPCTDSSSDSSGLELSKPGRLSSGMIGSSLSVRSEDLDISNSISFAAGPDNTPEENEYMSVDTLNIHVAEGPSTDLLSGNPGLHTDPQLQEEEVPCAWTASWAPWLGAAAAGVLVATLLAALYRRRLLQ